MAIEEGVRTSQSRLPEVTLLRQDGAKLLNVSEIGEHVPEEYSSSYNNNGFKTAIMTGMNHT
jgi:hypothetical protein